MGTAAEQLLNGMMASQLLLAIPLFILAAEFMNTGSIMDRLLHFCNAIVGRFRGGLAQVNVAAERSIFASMSGSALADAAASGKLMQTLMTQGRQVPAGVRRRAHLRVVGHRADHPAVDPAGALRADFGHVGRLPLPGRRGSRPAARRRPERADRGRGQAPQFPGREARAAARPAARDLGGAAGAADAGDPAGLPVQRHHHAHGGRRGRRRLRAAHLRAALPQRRA